MNREEAQQCYEAYKCLMHPPAQDFVERLIYTLPTAEQAATIPSCSYCCERPECIKAQRDELVQRFVEVSKEQAARREEVPEHAWNGIARDLFLAWDMGCKTPRELFDFIERCGGEIPQWLRDEPEMKALDHTPSKGTRAVIVYKAIHEAIIRGGQGG